MGLPVSASTLRMTICPSLAGVGRSYGDDSAVLRHVKEMLGRIEDAPAGAFSSSRYQPLP